MRALSLILAIVACVLVPTATVFGQEYYTSISNKSTKIISEMYFGYFGLDDWSDLGESLIDRNLYPGNKVKLGPYFECSFDMILMTSYGYQAIVRDTDHCDGSFEINDEHFIRD